MSSIQTEDSIAIVVCVLSGRTLDFAQSLLINRCKVLHLTGSWQGQQASFFGLISLASNWRHVSCHRLVAGFVGLCINVNSDLLTSLAGTCCPPFFRLRNENKCSNRTNGIANNSEKTLPDFGTPTLNANIHVRLFFVASEVTHLLKDLWITWLRDEQEEARQSHYGHLSDQDSQAAETVAGGLCSSRTVRLVLSSYKSRVLLNILVMCGFMIWNWSIKDVVSVPCIECQKGHSVFILFLCSPRWSIMMNPGEEASSATVNTKGFLWLFVTIWTINKSFVISLLIREKIDRFFLLLKTRCNTQQRLHFRPHCAFLHFLAFHCIRPNKKRSTFCESCVYKWLSTGFLLCHLQIEFCVMNKISHKPLHVSRHDSISWIFHSVHRSLQTTGLHVSGEISFQVSFQWVCWTHYPKIQDHAAVREFCLWNGRREIKWLAIALSNCFVLIRPSGDTQEAPSSKLEKIFPNQG